MASLQPGAVGPTVLHGGTRVIFFGGVGGRGDQVSQVSAVACLTGRTLTTKWLLWMTSNNQILGSLTSLGLVFACVCSI